jgi:hypothetical protein
MRQLTLENYGDMEVEEAFAVVFTPAAKRNYLDTHRIVCTTNDETNVREIRVEVPGMCESPSIEKYKLIEDLQSFQFKMIVDGNPISVVLADIVYVNDREYTAVYVEGTPTAKESPIQVNRENGISLT